MSEKLAGVGAVLAAHLAEVKTFANSQGTSREGFRSKQAETFEYAPIGHCEDGRRTHAPTRARLPTGDWWDSNVITTTNKMTKLSRLATLGLCIALAGCASDKYSFVEYSQRIDPRTGQYISDRDYRLNDVLALNYASSVVELLRAKYTGARITREISSTAQLGLAAAAAYGAAFNYSKSTLTVLGLASAGIPELQRLFGAKERAQTYQDAIRLIEEAEIEYLALNQQPSPNILTQNGVTLLQRVTASIHVVEKTLAGNLPSVEDMQKATEQMSRNGAKQTAPGAPVFNNHPANTETRPAELLSTRFEGPITSTTITLPDLPAPKSAARVRVANILRARIANYTDEASEVILAAGRLHADLQPQFTRTPQSGTPPRNYLFHLIDSANDAELEVWRSIIPVRPTAAATPTPSPTDPSLPPP